MTSPWRAGIRPASVTNDYIVIIFALYVKNGAMPQPRTGMPFGRPGLNRLRLPIPPASRMRCGAGERPDGSGRVCVLTAAAVRGAPGGPRTRKNIAVRLILSRVRLPIPPPALRYCGARGRPRTRTSLARLQPLKLACLPISPRGQFWRQRAGSNRHLPA